MLGLNIEDEWIVENLFGVVDISLAARLTNQLTNVAFNNGRIDQYISSDPVHFCFPGLSDLVVLVVIIFHNLEPTQVINVNLAHAHEVGTSHAT